MLTVAEAKEWMSDAWSTTKDKAIDAKDYAVEKAEDAWDWTTDSKTNMAAVGAIALFAAMLITYFAAPGALSTAGNATWNGIKYAGNKTLTGIKLGANEFGSLVKGHPYTSAAGAVAVVAGSYFGYTLLTSPANTKEAKAVRAERKEHRQTLAGINTTEAVKGLFDADTGSKTSTTSAAKAAEAAEEGVKK